jgi:hypothetical protein
MIYLLILITVICLLSLYSYLLTLDDDLDEVNNTNNDIMWDTLVLILQNHPTMEMIASIREYIKSYDMNEGKEVEYNFSHDNWTMVLCYLEKFHPELKPRVPLFGRHTVHPMKMNDFLWKKYPFLYPLIIITIVDMLIRHLIIRRKTASGQYHTSGLLLDYYVFYSYDRKISMWILDQCMKTMFNNWQEVFNIYHGNPDHYNYKVYQVWMKEVQGE